MKLASIETISEILPHSNADNLAIAKVLGWQCIVKKDEFKAGDKIVFVVIDTILPANAPWSQFLKDKKNPDKSIRLKTIKLRGEYSQGLILPLSILPEAVQAWHLGADVGGELGIKKYEKEIPTQLAGIALGGFPSHVVATTDEENGLSNPDLVQEVLSHPELTITLKLDGSSCTIIARDGEIWQVCSRRLSLKETESNGFWKAARQLKIPRGFTGAIQSELMGPGVQGNQLKLSEPTLFVFQIRQNDRFLSYEEMQNITHNILGTYTVPLITHKESKTFSELDQFQTLADSQKIVKSLFPNLELNLKEGEEPHAEGIVVRPKTYKASGNGRPLGFKIINRNYKD